MFLDSESMWIGDSVKADFSTIIDSNDGITIRHTEASDILIPPVDRQLQFGDGSTEVGSLSGIDSLAWGEMLRIDGEDTIHYGTNSNDGHRFFVNRTQQAGDPIDMEIKQDIVRARFAIEVSAHTNNASLGNPSGIYIYGNQIGGNWSLRCRFPDGTIKTIIDDT